MKGKIWCVAIVMAGANLWATVASGDDWPQWLGPHRDGTWRESGIVETFPPGGPPIIWRQKIAGGYAGPAVAGTRVFVTDYVLTDGDPTPDPGLRNELRGRERIHCLDVATGATLWLHEYPCDYRISFPAGPRCTPVVDVDVVYCLGAMGDLKCLAIDTGRVVWERQLLRDYQLKEPPMWGFAAHPLVHGPHLYCVVGGQGADGKGAVAVCFNKQDGSEVWHSVSAPEPGYCPPTLIEFDGRSQLLIWDPENLNSLDPQTGEIFWSLPCQPQYGMSIVAPAVEGDRVLVAGIGEASLLARLLPGSRPAAEVIWSGKGFHPIHSPFRLEGEHFYGVDRGGQLRCWTLDDCQRLWSTTEPTTGERPQQSGTGFLIKNGDRYFIAGETGQLTIARLTPEKYESLGAVQLLEPTQDSQRGVLWSCPAFAGGRMYWRNDKEIICVDLRGANYAPAKK